MPTRCELEIKPIRNEEDHAAALAEIALLMEKDLDEAGEDRLDVLTTLAEAYEREHHALGVPSDPVAALKAHMETSGKTQTDLANLLGSRSRASEILSRQTPLSLSMIRKLNEAWGLPAEILVREVTLVAERPSTYARQRRGGQRSVRRSVVRKALKKRSVSRRK